MLKNCKMQLFSRFLPIIMYITIDRTTKHKKIKTGDIMDFTKKEIRELLVSLQSKIEDNFLIDDDTPCIEVTICCNDNVSLEKGEWDYQTGDLCFYGPIAEYAYSYTVYLSKESNCEELANEIVELLTEESSYILDEIN